jgi:hypothetical protein
MFAWVFAYGFCAGGVAALLQAGIVSIDPGNGRIGGRIGMAYSVVAVASLVGGPVGRGWRGDLEFCRGRRGDCSARLCRAWGG